MKQLFAIALLLMSVNVLADKPADEKEPPNPEQQMEVPYWQIENYLKRIPCFGCGALGDQQKDD